MRIADIQSGLYTGIVSESSRSEPAPADEITYTVAINLAGGTIYLENVKPQEAARWSSYMPADPGGELPFLNPFPPGHRVPLHIERQGDTLTVFIDRGEVPAFGGCE
jgi:hypothetical protein